MKTLNLFGKVNLSLGIIFFILGVILFIQKFDGAFIFTEQYLSFSFICLGIALCCSSFFSKKEEK